MTAQQLKASILQLAIQGRLVPQNPADEPASVLLTRIKAEKDAHVKAGKLKKDKHESVIIRREDGHYLEKKDGKTTDITDEIPFDIPESWEWVRLSSICIIIVDCPHSTPHYLVEDTGYWGIDTNCIEKSGLISHFRYVDKETYNQRIARLKPQKGDIVFSREGTIGLTCILPDGNICLGQRVMLFRLSSLMSLGYVKNVLSGKEFIKRLLQENRGTGAKHVNVSEITEALIPLPPLEEQARIVAKIEELLPHIAEYGRAETELSKLNAELPEQLKKSILQWAIQGRLVPQDPTDEPAPELLKRIKAEKAALIKSGKLKKEKPLPPISEDEIPFDIPDSWQWVRLGSIISLISGQDFPPSGYNDRQDGIPYITGASNMDNGKLIVNRWTKMPSSIAQQGDLLITCKGTVGEMVIMNIPQAHVARQIMAIRSIREIQSKFIEIVLRAEMNSITGQKNGLIPGISREVLLQLLFPLPPLAEQERIVNKLKVLISTIHFC